MYTLDTGSIGCSAGIHFHRLMFLLIITQRGADKILSGKPKLGADASAVAGPSGANAAAFNDPNIDVLSVFPVERSLRRRFVRECLHGLRYDKANKALYGTDIEGAHILRLRRSLLHAQPLVEAVEVSACKVRTTFADLNYGLRSEIDGRNSYGRDGGSQCASPFQNPRRVRPISSYTAPEPLHGTGFSLELTIVSRIKAPGCTMIIGIDLIS